MNGRVLSHLFIVAEKRRPYTIILIAFWREEIKIEG